jgi:hypothetical protein
MANEDVTLISGLFNIEPEIVEASIKDGALGARIVDSLTKKNLFDAKSKKILDIESFKQNFKADVTNSYFNELVEQSKKGDVPQELFKNIKGAALQQKEKEFAKKYEITEYSNLDDLVDKVASKTTANGKPIPEYEKKIHDLQEINLKLVKEKDEALNTVETKYKSLALDREKQDAFRQIPINLTKFKETEVEEAKKRIQKVVLSVFENDYALDFDEKQRPVVKDKAGVIQKNLATLEPLSVSEVMTNVAKYSGIDLRSPDTGGQGDQSSRSSESSFTNYEEFFLWCKSKNIDQYSKEALSAWKKAGIK